MCHSQLEMEEVNPKASAPLPPKPPSPTPPKMPTALPKLESFLEEKHLRLLDFFKRMDKNKDWLVTVDDLQSVVKQYDIPVTEKECMKLFSSIETKKKGEMSYKELLRGISKWTSKLNRSSSHLSRIRDQDLEAMEEEDCAEKDDDGGDSADTRSSPVVESVSEGPLSTMEGMAREGDIRYKVKLQQQFNDVCKLFEEEGLVMEKTLLERGIDFKMYAYAYITRMYVFHTYVCTYSHMFICVYIYMDLCMYRYICKQMYLTCYDCFYVYVHTYVGTYTYNLQLLSWL